MKILIQSGHGARTSGSTGAPSEQKWTTEIVPKIAEALRDHEFYVKEVMADPSDAEISGDWDLFLAVHYDADMYNDRGGFIDTPEASTDGATIESNRIASEMRKTYFSITGIPERMNRSNKNTKFYYMWSKLSAKTPCVILEAGVGFRTPEDHQTLWFQQDKVVKGIVDGIVNALKPEPIPEPPVNYEETIKSLEDEVTRLEMDKKSLEDDVRELNFENEKLAEDLEMCQFDLENGIVNPSVEIKETEYTKSDEGKDIKWKIDGLRADSNGLKVGNYSKV